MDVPDGSSAKRRSVRRSLNGSRTIIVEVDGSFTPANVTDLCERARRLLESSDAAVLTCDVGALTHPDAVAIDALARLQLAAQRLGRSIRLRHAGRRLQDLLDLVGLADVLPLCDGASPPDA
ncbi:MAG: STAS domain-containing protein [Acidimicrobiales bacterium]